MRLTTDNLKPVCYLLLLAMPAAQLAFAQQTDETPAESLETEATAAPAPVANWLETRILIEELYENGDFEAAAELFEQLVELAQAQFGEDSEEVAEAHLLIAQVQRRNGEFTAAETSILAAIAVNEAREGTLSAALIDPYMELGDNYFEAGDFGASISAYTEARSIGRRNYGLLNQGQIEIIDAMSAASDELGQLEESQQLQLEALTLIERTYSETSVEAIEARYKYAAWLRRHRSYDEERRIYFEIQRMIQRQHNDDPLMLVRAFRARAESFRDEDNGDALGISGLRESVDLLEALEDPPALLLAEVYVDIGDWNLEFQRAGTTGEEYLVAWDWLGRTANAAALRSEWFDELIVVEMDPVSSRGLSNDPNDPAGFVEIHFTVDTGGRPRDIEITDSHPAGLKDAAFLRQYREARFRPRIVNGEFVPIRRARRNEFRYIPLDSENGAN